MYIKKITLKNICCFENLEIELSPQRDLGNWLLLLGDNGVGKTSVLRSIAMGLCLESDVSALLSELYGDMVRYQSDDAIGQIYIEFDKQQNSKSLFIKTKIKNIGSGNYKVTQETYPRTEFPWSEVFVCGYGASRGGYAANPIRDYHSVDAVYTLFNYDAPLQSAELALRRIDKDQQEIVYEILNSILMRPTGALKLSKSGFVAQGSKEGSIPAGGWGDGHRVTLNWLLDLIGWANMHNDSAVLEGISGIVIIDEIEQHLHPIWQRRIIKLLNERFPKIQFIASTHSSLCAIGTTDLKDDECDLLVLNMVGDESTGVTVKPMRHKRADQVLTSYFFDVDSVRSDDISTDISRYSKLRSKKSLNRDEKNEVEELRNKLNNNLGGMESELQQLVEKAVSDTVQKMIPEYFASNNTGALDASAVDFEIKRQLSELFSGK